MKPAAALAFCAIAFAQSTAVVVANPTTAKWTHDAGDPPGSESVFLRQDAITGGMEMLVRFPAGHVIAPHWHSANERLMVIEGSMTVRVGEGPENTMVAGGFAFLPAKEVQYIACGKQNRCAFYLGWDGKLDNHRVTK